MMPPSIALLGSRLGRRLALPLLLGAVACSSSGGADDAGADDDDDDAAVDDDAAPGDGDAAPGEEGDFPNASNTGPSGPLTLTSDSWTPVYVDTAGMVLDSLEINGSLIVRAPDVVVTNCKVNGTVLTETDDASLTIRDSLIDGGEQTNIAAVSAHDTVLERVEVIGSPRSVQCSGNCTVIDSWLHDQYLPADSDAHEEAFISNGGSGFVLRHNTLQCTPEPSSNGACTSNVSFFGDFAPISDVLVERNLFKETSTNASYCLYAGHNPDKPYGSNPTDVRILDNVFERGPNGQCGVYGPVTSYLSANGNEWSGNVWDDGTALEVD